MNKKIILMASVFLGIGIYAIPIFVDIGVGETFLKILAGLIMFSGTVYFVVGSGSKLKKRVKSGELTQQQAYEIEMAELEAQIAKEKKLFELEKQRSKLRELKQDNKSGSKMPDVLNNLAPIIGSKDKKKGW